MLNRLFEGKHQYFLIFSCLEDEEEKARCKAVANRMARKAIALGGKLYTETSPLHFLYTFGYALVDFRVLE